ncbi:MAG: chromosome segregation protein SMC [Pseudomonadota bacterium]
MKFTSMRLVGFKSFVEATDFEIHDGLTGIVGPNGCGKSNLLEALRWVMGATSAKALRGGGMADVVFAGTSMRPARNWAEVTLTLDNSDRSAPAEYNEETTLEVSRRLIKRDDGVQSVYRLNSKEVRAKDVQLLFADASSGANSPALVRQGQVAELINSKPQNRRRLLEEAAGVTGLHNRRHEADLRLRAAETNLERLNDVTDALETQKNALSRQARQAQRYRNLSGDIRRTEAMAAHLRCADATAGVEEAASVLESLSVQIEEKARNAATTATVRAETQTAIDPLREAEAIAGAALARLEAENDALSAEAERIAATIARLTDEEARLQSDIDRENALAKDAEDALLALETEAKSISAREASEASRLEAASTAADETAERAGALETALADAMSEAAAIESRRRSAEASLAQSENALTRLNAREEQLSQEISTLEMSADDAARLAAAEAEIVAAEEAARISRLAFSKAEEALTEYQSKEERCRTSRREAEKAYDAAAAEREGLARAVADEGQGDWTPVIDAVRVEPGYERALAAALGDDLAAGMDPSAPAFWSQLEAQTSDGFNAQGPALPVGATPLSAFVEAPPALHKRLAAIGVVDHAAGDRLHGSLERGVRIVSRDGALWRWDGFRVSSEAKSQSAVRLEQRNRLEALDQKLSNLSHGRAIALEAHGVTETALEQQRVTVKEARRLIDEDQQRAEQARTTFASLEREQARSEERRSALQDALRVASEDRASVLASRDEASQLVEELPATDGLEQRISVARSAAAEARAAASDARAAHGTLSREAAMRAERLETLTKDQAAWQTRASEAASRRDEVQERFEKTVHERQEAAKAPAALEERRHAIADRIDGSSAERRKAADALAAAVLAAEEADRDARAADAAAAEAREARARAEAHAESAQERLNDAVNRAHETCGVAPEQLLEITEHNSEEPLPELSAIERKLEKFKADRERLGGVNLRADEEMTEIAEKLEEMTSEREDCEAAIRKLRAAIGSLNREARQRLLDAFETVNKNFSELFTQLFNGGQAELRMVDAEDVLEAGLEIYASPPGKKLTTMSLMSGGEQALTAIALIFAVFKSNPAPVCVLDEVDAPLDDANTERFCTMLHRMADETETRFIVITHHALTMSRMDRLFGVTMIERGVSQLVSVDLQRAAQMAAE